MKKALMPPRSGGEASTNDSHKIFKQALINRAGFWQALIPLKRPGGAAGLGADNPVNRTRIISKAAKVGLNLDNQLPAYRRQCSRRRRCGRINRRTVGA